MEVEIKMTENKTFIEQEVKFIYSNYRKGLE